jgi:hypothetical protein
MVDQPVSLDDLLNTREDLIKEIVGKMPGPGAHQALPSCV